MLSKYLYFNKYFKYFIKSFILLFKILFEYSKYFQIVFLPTLVKIRHVWRMLAKLVETLIPKRLIDHSKSVKSYIEWISPHCLATYCSQWDVIDHSRWNHIAQICCWYAVGPIDGHAVEIR